MILNQKGVIQFLPLLIIVAGLVAGLYLVQHPTIFKPKAQTPISAPVTITKTPQIMPQIINNGCFLVGTFTLSANEIGIWQARTLNGYIINCASSQCIWEVQKDGEIVNTDSGFNNFTSPLKVDGEYIVKFSDPRNYECAKLVTVNPQSPTPRVEYVTPQSISPPPPYTTPPSP